MTTVVQIPFDQLIVAKTNVRRSIGDISELTSSIREHGMLQPIVVRAVNGYYEVIAGSRRVAAARAAGFDTVPALITELQENNALVASLVENLQRGELDVEEEGLAYEELLNIHGSMRKVAELVSKSPTHIGRVLDALSALRRLRPTGMDVSVTSGHSQEHEQRGNGRLLPFRHATALESTFRSPSITELWPEEKARTEKYLELAQIIAPLPQRQAEEVLGRFRQSPGLSVESIRDEVVAPVSVHTRLAPELAQRLSEQAQAQGIRAEDLASAALESLMCQELQVKELSSVAVQEGKSKAPSLSFKDAIHSKIMWNLQRVDVRQFDHFTIGYSGRTLDQLIQVLEIAQVKVLIDVRDHPYSQHRPEISRDSLHKTLSAKGIGYIHWGDMGVPKEIRDHCDRQSLFAWYDGNVLPGRLADLRLTRCAFMCTEVDPQSCHRHRIARYLEGLGNKVLDL